MGRVAKKDRRATAARAVEAIEGSAAAADEAVRLLEDRFGDDEAGMTAEDRAMMRAARAAARRAAARREAARAAYHNGADASGVVSAADGAGAGGAGAGGGVERVW